MKEKDYINAANLTRIEIAHKAISDLVEIDTTTKLGERVQISQLLSKMSNRVRKELNIR